MKTKKLIAVILCCCMILSIVGCAQQTQTPPPVSEEKPEPAEEEKPLINGSFEGTSTGMQGPITAKITVKDSKITAIEFTENAETANVTVVAFERIPAQIIENQSLSVDAVTGATLSSFGIIGAVTNAAKSAGLDVDSLKANKVAATPKDPQTWDTDVFFFCVWIIFICRDLPQWHCPIWLRHKFIRRYPFNICIVPKINPHIIPLL